MSIKRVTGLALVLFAVICMLAAFIDLYKTFDNKNAISAKKSDITTASPPESAKRTIRVYFFYGNGKCPTCDAIKDATIEAISDIEETYFKKCAINIEWKGINIEEAGNEKYITRFNLFSTTVVLQDSADHKNWKRLDEVWNLASDREILRKYIKEQILKFAGGCS